MDVYVINLQKDVERRRSIEGMLQSLGFKPVFIGGVYGKDIPKGELELLYDDAKARAMMGRSLYVSEIGCSLSHLRAYEHFLASKSDVAIVMEDDAVVDRRFREVIQDLEGIRIDADILLLGHHPPHSSHKLTLASLWGRRGVGKSQYIGFPVEPAFGAYCYAITRDAAASILARNHPVWAPADYFTAGADGTVRNVILCPVVATVNFGLASTIQLDRNAALGTPPRHQACFGGRIYEKIKKAAVVRWIRRLVTAALRELKRVPLLCTRGPRPNALTPMIWGGSRSTVADH